MTGADTFSDEGYVDTFAEVMGLDPDSVQKVSIPAEVMDDIYAGKISLSDQTMQVKVDTGAKRDPRGEALFQVNRIIQRLAPNVHHWDRSVFFSIDRLKEDTGWQPEYNFRAAVEETWEWMQSSGRHESVDFDFGFEDDLLERIAAL